MFPRSGSRRGVEPTDNWYTKASTDSAEPNSIYV